MHVFLVFIAALALGIGSSQYYLQSRPAPPVVLAQQTQITEPTSIPTPSPTLEPTITPTLEPTLSATPTPKPSNTPKPTATPTRRPTIVLTPTVTVTPITTPTSTPAPVATLAVTYTLVLAPPGMEPIFAEMANKYHVDANLLKKIADCESHFNSGVVSRNGLYAGMFQFAAGTWISNRTAMGMDTNPDLRFGVRESIETAAFVLSRGGAASSWPTCSR